MMDTKKVRKQLLTKTSIKPLTADDYVGTGSTLLNLAISGNPYRGFAKGYYYYLVGDTQSGKTWLSLTCLAEASINKNFDGYRFIFDNGEQGALMDMERFFGKKVADRIEPPRIVKGEAVCSYTLEDFYFNVHDAIQKGEPFIYILDSMDSLTSTQELGKFEERKKAARKGKTTTGSMGDGKAKINSQDLRQLLTPLYKAKSILIVINQTRDNLKLGYGAPLKTRSGGHAPSFYACLELWSSVKGKIFKNSTIMSSTTGRKSVRKRELGTYCKIRVKKNRMTGKDRTIVIPIYHSFGIDDIGSCVDYLVEEFRWGKKGVKIEAHDLSKTATRDKLIQFIEKRNLEKDVRDIMEEVWLNAEKQCEVIRKKRY